MLSFRDFVIIKKSARDISTVEVFKKSFNNGLMQTLKSSKLNYVKQCHLHANLHNGQDLVHSH